MVELSTTIVQCTMVDSSTTLAGVALHTPLMNASGCLCTTEKELVTLAMSTGLGAVVTKSMTLEPRDGNAKPRYGETRHGTINANGLCNLGFQAYAALYAQKLRQLPLPTFFSMSAMNVRDFERMLAALAQAPRLHQPRLIEVNVSCPNLPGGGNGAINLSHLSKVLLILSRYGQSMRSRFGLKLPPLFSMPLTQQVTWIIHQYKDAIRFVTCSNSIPKGFLIDPNTDKPFLKPNDGFGGVGGRYMKPITLAEVRRFRHCLDDAIDVVGCGGVTTGRDVYDLLLAGACAVQVGSALTCEGPTCFQHLNWELKTILSEKNFKSVSAVPKLTYPSW